MATIQRPLIPDLPETKNSLKRTLYVGGLDDNVTAEILEAAFIPFGDIRTTAIPKDRITGKHRGFGFIEFEEEEDAQHAISNMHDAELYGRVLTVNLARAPARQPGEGSRPVWGDDTFLRQRYLDQPEKPAERQEEDPALAALMKCSEAQEMMEEQLFRECNTTEGNQPESDVV